MAQQYQSAPYTQVPYNGPVMGGQAVFLASSQFAQSLFGCCGDMGGCCYTLLCPFCSLAQTKSDLDGSNCCINCIIGPCMGCCWRGDVRGAYGIPGSFMEDLLVFCCCTACAICQMQTQVKQTKVVIAPPVGYMRQ
jgi:Cys-rich protein (TIGR01571 family)